MFESVIKQQESMLASENLAGNVVKAEFHKGALYALRLVEAVYEEARQNTKESPGTAHNTGSPKLPPFGEFEAWCRNACISISVCKPIYEWFGRQLRAGD